MMYSPFRHISSIFIKGRPIHLTFFVTSRCNARCPFCFYVKNRDGDERFQEELTLDEIERVSSSLGNLLWLAFSGGEIFLRKDILDISRIFYKNNKPAIILYPTNGLLPEIIYENIKAVLEHCRKSTVVVKLSIDGLGALHDELRGVKNSFEKVIQTYDLLSGLPYRYHNFDLGINTVFCSANQNQMGEIIKFVNSMKRINTHTVSLVRGEIAEEGYKAVDIEKYLKTIEEMEKNLKAKIASRYRFRGAKVKAAQDILQRRLIFETMKENKRHIPCYAGRLNLVLTESGDIYPCESFNMKMGNLKDYNYDIRELLKGEEAGRVVNSIENSGCYCTHECYFMTNILFNPRSYPRLAKEYLQL